jgi:transposase
MSKVSRVEVMSSGARRRWTLAEKRRIVAESYGGPGEVSATARRHGLSGGQLFTWRRLAREGRLGDEVAALVPVEIVAPTANSPRPTEERGPDETAALARSSKSTGLIVIELGHDRALLAQCQPIPCDRKPRNRSSLKELCSVFQRARYKLSKAA